MSTNEHVKVLEQMRKHAADGGETERTAALDAAIAALKALDAEPDADLELIWHSVSDNKETNAAYRRLKARLAALKAEKPTAAHIDAILRESDTQVPVAATLDEAAADPTLTLDVARDLLRDAAAGIRSLAASATPRTEPVEGRESECPWGGCGDCVGHEVTQPAGDGAREGGA